MLNYDSLPLDQLHEKKLFVETCVVAEHDEADLPPTDVGRAAWSFMVGSVMIDAVIWG